jgi:hypothetical protein
MIHELKINEKSFESIEAGFKRHEIRRWDRPFKVGDTLRLRTYHPESGTYGSRTMDVYVSHITHPGEWGLPDDVGVMSISKLPCP